MENLHYFLTNILNLILFKGYYYCSCEKFGEKKGHTRIPTICSDVEKMLDYNTDNAVFLKAYQTKLVPYLLKYLILINKLLTVF